MALERQGDGGVVVDGKGGFRARLWRWSVKVMVVLLLMVKASALSVSARCSVDRLVDRCIAIVGGSSWWGCVVIV